MTTPASVDPRQRLTTNEVGRELGLKRQAVRKSLDAARVPYMQRGRHGQRLYTRADLDAFIAKYTVKP